MIQFIRDRKTNDLCRVLHYGSDGFLTVRMRDKKTHFVKRDDAIMISAMSLAPGLPEVARKIA